ncbi:DNA polymerase delta subunit 3-like isoform X2 [Clavelina lepadiformis]|uniref:DNA polymerase delta subunit 3-like isoform X2 n=1 Tax=Clavelina lepadiformis TaxID=159417 RepID=UPI004041E377
MENLDTYLATVDELVDDENKIVTYKSLSHHLALPADQAKEVLEFYVQSCGAGKISVIYSLTGRSHKGVSVSIVRDTELEQKKSSLKLVLSCFPYSVQKAKMRDAAPLYASDYDMTKAGLYQCGNFSSVRFNGAKKLSDDEILKKLKSSAFHSGLISFDPEKTLSSKKLSNKSPPANKIPSLFASKVKTKDSPESKKLGAGENLPENSTSDKHKQDVSKKSAETISNKETNHKKIFDKKTKPTNRKAAGMDAFMTKGKQDLFKNENPTTANTEVTSVIGTSPEQPEPTSPENKREIQECLDAMEVDENFVEESDKVLKNVKKAKITPPKKRPANKKKSRGNSGELPAKKRRRIVPEELSSSSESEEENFDEIDVIPPSPEPAPPMNKAAALNPRRKRVLKSKTYMDDDGAMVTKKEYQDVSCSSEDDSDVTKKAKENKTPPDAKKKPIFDMKPVAKSKQTSLMGFFAKKS